MTNHNMQIVQTLQRSFVSTIKHHMETNGYNQIEFKEPFRIYAEEQVYYNDYIKTPWVAQSLFKDGSLIAKNETEEGSFVIDTMLDIYELAHILDVLQSGRYTAEIEVDDEDFIDPAGGRGLQSHI